MSAIEYNKDHQNSAHMRSKKKQILVKSKGDTQGDTGNLKDHSPRSTYPANYVNASLRSADRVDEELLMCFQPVPVHQGNASECDYGEKFPYRVR